MTECYWAFESEPFYTLESAEATRIRAEKNAEFRAQMSAEIAEFGGDSNAGQESQLLLDIESTQLLKLKLWASKFPEILLPNAEAAGAGGDSAMETDERNITELIVGQHVEPTCNPTYVRAFFAAVFDIRGQFW